MEVQINRIVMKSEIFIAGDVPSSKRQKGLYPTKATAKYLQKIGVKSYSAKRKEVVTYKNRPNLFKESIEPLWITLADSSPPYLVGFHFVRRTRGIFDFNNITQILQDLMIAHGVIPDDSMRFFIPFPVMRDNAWYTVDKDNAGVWISFFEREDY